MTNTDNFANIIAEGLEPSDASVEQTDGKQEKSNTRPSVAAKTTTAPIKKSKVTGDDSWSKDNTNSDPWGTPNLLHVHLADESLTARWVLDNSGIKRSNVQNCLNKGWRFAKIQDIAEQSKVGFEYGLPMDGLIRVRDTILMVIPKVRMAARARAIERDIPNAKDNVRNFESEVRSSGIKVGFIDDQQAGNMPLYQADPSVKRDDRGVYVEHKDGSRTYG